MKKIKLIAIAIIALLISCGGNVAEYIYPYADFETATLTSSGKKVAGVKLLKHTKDLSSLPEKVEIDGVVYPVEYFIGYSSDKAAEEAKTLTVSENIKEMADDSIANAINLEELIIEGDVDISNLKLPQSLTRLVTKSKTWETLPDMGEKNGYPFVGWYYKDSDGTEKKVVPGEAKPDGAAAYPVWKCGLTLSNIQYAAVSDVNKLVIAIKNSAGGTVDSVTMSKGSDGIFTPDYENKDLLPSEYTLDITPYEGSTPETSFTKGPITINGGDTSSITGDISGATYGTLQLDNISFGSESTEDITATIKKGNKTIGQYTLTEDNKHSLSENLVAGDYTITFTSASGSSVDIPCTIGTSETTKISGDIAIYTTDGNGNYTVTKNTKEALNAAIQAAAAYGSDATVKVSGDIDLEKSSISIESGNVTIDLNGHTVTGNISTSATSFAITDTADNQGRVNGSVTVYSGEVTISGGTISSTADTTLDIKKGAVVHMLGGTVENTGSKTAIQTEGTLSVSNSSEVKSNGNAIIETGGTTFINGGTITATGSSAAIEVDDNATITISGGTVTGATGNATIDVEEKATANITGGTVKNTNSNGSAIDTSGELNISSNATIESAGRGISVDNGSTVSVTGGTITTTGTKTAIIVHQGGTYTQDGGQINSSADGIEANGGTTTLTSGEVKTDSGYSIKKTDDSATVTIDDSMTLSGSSDYTITYYPNYEGSTSETKKKYYGITATLSSISRSGYDFSGWNTQADGKGTSYAAGVQYTENKSISLYASWGKKGYTITYKAANNLSGADIIETKETGKSYTILSSPSFTSSSGYRFTYWNTKEDNSGTRYYAGGTYSIDRNLTLYAQSYDASNYSVNGSTIPTGQSYVVNGSVYDSFYLNGSFKMGANWCRLVQASPESTSSNTYGFVAINPKDSTAYYITVIGSNAFSSANSITTVYFANPYLLAKIETGAFTGCKSGLVIDCTKTLMNGVPVPITDESNMLTQAKWQSAVTGIDNITFPSNTTVILKEGEFSVSIIGTLTKK